jgi:hypothetical protein
MRLAVRVVLLIPLLLAAETVAQQADPDSSSATASCTFADGNEISVRHNNSVAGSKPEPRNGEVWAPGGAPLTLFTQSVIAIHNVQIPVGAYSMYVIAGRKAWILIVNKNVKVGSPYDEKQDLVRAPMEIGQLSQPVKPLEVSFDHIAPTQCSLRIYYGKTGAFVEFTEK